MLQGGPFRTREGTGRETPGNRRYHTCDSSIAGNVVHMAYEVHLDVYDGPFNLLLQLISADEVDVYSVCLADIVDAFVRELERVEALDLELATEFLVVAATLVELKCRRLLPTADEDTEDDVALFEARDQLLSRLVECKTFAGAAAVLADLESLAARAFPRRAGPDDRFDGIAPDLLAGIVPDDLARAARSALARERVTMSTSHVHGDEVTVAETIEALRAVLPGREKTTLRELLDDDRNPVRIVATFLALLELYKQELVDLAQSDNFGSLVVVWRGTTASAEAPIDDYGEVRG